jgi:solute:Na+ symporter, SSS family
MNQMMITALASIAIILFISYLEGKGKIDEKGINLTSELFKTTPAFNIGAITILIICTLLYAIFW